MKADLKRVIKDKKDMVESRIKFLVDEARLFIVHVQEAKGDTRKKLDEVYDVLDTFRRQYELIEACNMQIDVHEAVLAQLEE